MQISVRLQLDISKLFSPKRQMRKFTIIYLQRKKRTVIHTVNIFVHRFFPSIINIVSIFTILWQFRNWISSILENTKLVYINLFQHNFDWIFYDENIKNRMPKHPVLSIDRHCCKGIEVLSCEVSCKIFVVRLRTDHSAIISAELERWHIAGYP